MPVSQRAARRGETRTAVGDTSPTVPGRDEDDSDTLALQTLKSVCKDKEAPAAARAQAARTLLELSGALRDASRTTQSRPIGEWSLAEIDARLSALGESGIAKNADTGKG